MKHYTERFTDLGKLNPVWFGFRLKLIFATPTAASKNHAQFKSFQI
jgi:hypothetical protein